MTPYHTEHTCQVIPRARKTGLPLPAKVTASHMRHNKTHQLGADGRPVCEEIRPSMSTYGVTGDLGEGIVDCHRCWNVAGHSRD